jgi:hypothetical protein
MLNTDNTPLPVTLVGVALDDAMQAYVLQQATAKRQAAEALKAPKGRRGFAKDIWEAVNNDRVPDPLQFPVSNYWSQKKADVLYALAACGDHEALADHHIGGTNTYAKALRVYRDACLTLLQRRAEAAAADAAQDAQGVAA